MKIPVNFIKSNVLPFYVIQASAYIFGILTIPWLTRKLGVQVFGIYSYAIAFVTYFTLLTDWGFNLSATKLISKAVDDEEIAKVVANTLAARVFLLVISTFVFLVALMIMPRLQAYAEYLLIAYLGVVGSALNTMFLYQGAEKMRSFALQNIVTRFIGLLLILFLVESSEDLDIALTIQSLSVILLSIFGLYSARKLVFIGLSKLSLSYMYELLVKGWPLFLSSASISLYTNTNVIILGMVSGLEAVGYFSAAQTIAKGVSGLFYPAIQAVYPRLSQIASSSIDRVPQLLAKLLVYFGVSGFAIATALWVSSSYVIPIFYGVHFSGAIVALEWLSPMVFFIAISNVAGLAGLIPIGEERIFARILLIFGLVNIFSVAMLGYFFGAAGGGAGLVLTELGVAGSMLIALARRKMIFSFRIGGIV